MVKDVSRNCVALESPRIHLRGPEALPDTRHIAGARLLSCCTHALLAACRTLHERCQPARARRAQCLLHGARAKRNVRPSGVLVVPQRARLALRVRVPVLARGARRPRQRRGHQRSVVLRRAGLGVLVEELKVEVFEVALLGIIRAVHFRVVRVHLPGAPHPRVLLLVVAVRPCLLRRVAAHTALRLHRAPHARPLGLKRREVAPGTPGIHLGGRIGAKVEPEAIVLVLRARHKEVRVNGVAAPALVLQPVAVGLRAARRHVDGKEVLLRGARVHGDAPAGQVLDGNRLLRVAVPHDKRPLRAGH